MTHAPTGAQAHERIPYTHVNTHVYTHIYKHDACVLTGAEARERQNQGGEQKDEEGISEEEYDEEEYDPTKHMLAEEAYESGEDIGDPVRVDSNGNWSPGMEVLYF